MTNNQLKYIVLAGIFAVPFVPFIISSSLLFPFITGKAFAFRIIVECILAAYIVLALRDETYRPKFSWILGSVITFLAVIGFADILANNPFKSFWSNYERMEGYITLLHLGAYFLVVGSVLREQSTWNKLIGTTLGASFMMAIYSFFQIAGKIVINQGGVRVDGTLGNASYLGIYMVFHIFFAALLFVRSKKDWQKVLLAIVAIANLVVLYFTATRGAILGLLGGALVTFSILLFKSQKGDGIRKVALGGLLALVVFVGLFVSIKDTNFVKESPVLSRFASLSLSEVKTQGRYFVWPMAIKGFVEKPILGWGQEGFNFVFNKYYDPRMYNQEPWFDRAHNTFLDWLIAGGLLGLLSYLAIIFSLVYYALTAKEDFLKKEDKAILLGVLSAYMFNNLFVFDQIVSYILFFTVLAYAHSHAPETKFLWWDKFSSKMRNLLNKEKAYPITESIVIIALVLVLYFVNFVPWRQSESLLNILALSNQGTIAKYEDYSALLSKNSLGFSENLEHLSQIVIGLSANQNVPNETKQKLFELTDKAFLKHLERVPNDTRYRLFYGLFLSRFGWYGKAVEQLKIARELSPNKQQVYFELVSNLIADGKLEEALVAAKTAYDLEPNYTEAKFIYGLTLLASGQNELSQKVFADTPIEKIILDDRYISVLAMLKKYNELISVVEKRIELDPSNIQNRITLAASYLEAGRREDAVRAIQKIIELDPSFKERGEYYISEIRAGRNP